MQEMTNEQYAIAHMLMKHCREFVEKVNAVMDSSGLTDMGYHLEITTRACDYSSGERSRGIVTIEKSAFEDDYLESVFRQRNYVEKGWMNDHDPFRKKCSVPPVVRTRTIKEVVFPGEAEDGGKAYPPDGLWISAYDDPGDVDGGQ